MMFSWIRKPALLGLGLSATMAAGLAGCGDQTADKDNAVAVPDPTAVVNSRSSTAPSAKSGAPAGGATASTPSESKATETVKAEGWGTLKGRVIFDGTPPPAATAVLQEVGKAAKDPEICAKTQPIKAERLVVNSGSKGVKNVFVYLQRPTAVNEEAKKEALGKHPEFDQKNCTYIPHALAVMTGETVTVKSSDPTNHNVNFQLKNLNKNPLIAPGTTMDITPDSPERAPGPVSCSIHPWMLAHWLVLDHPYFAVTDENGNFEIKNAPAGTQKVVVWQEAAGYVTPAAGQPINIKPNAATEEEFKIDPAKLKLQ